MAPVSDIHMNFKASKFPKGNGEYANWLAYHCGLAPICPQFRDKSGKAWYITTYEKSTQLP